MQEKTIIETTAIAISLDRSFIMFSRDADCHSVTCGIPYFETVHRPVCSKKGPSFFEDPTYFVFSEAVFLCYHARGLDPTCFSS